MVSNPSPGLHFNVDQQCQFVFGPSATLCPYMVGPIVYVVEMKKFFSLIVFSQCASDCGALPPTGTKLDAEPNICRGQTVHLALIATGYAEFNLLRKKKVFCWKISNILVGFLVVLPRWMRSRISGPTDSDRRWLGPMERMGRMFQELRRRRQKSDAGLRQPAVCVYLIFGSGRLTINLFFQLFYIFFSRDPSILRCFFADWTETLHIFLNVSRSFRKIVELCVKLKI